MDNLLALMSACREIKEREREIRENKNLPVHAEINPKLFSFSVILVVNALNREGF
jgi:hypothetical protein